MMTPNTGIPYVPEGTLDPAAGLNDSLNHIDALMQTSVVSMSLTTPPVTNSDGDMYVVGAGSPSGDWAGHEGDLARYVADGDFWQFFQAGSEVKLVLNQDDGGLYKYLFDSPGPGWVLAAGLSDAPIDGQPYVRQDGGWVEMPVDSGGGGGGPGSIVVQDSESPPGLVDPTEAIVFGEGFTVTELETGVALIEFAGGGGGDSPAPAFMGASLQRTTDLSLAATTLTDIPWEAEDYDEGGFWDAGDPTIMTVPADGYYLMTTSIRWDNTASSAASYLVHFEVNADGIRHGAVYNTGSVNFQQTTSVVLKLLAGDEVKVVVYSGNGADIDVFAGDVGVTITRLDPPVATGSGDAPLSPDSPPATPDPADDEFDGAALDTAGTRFAGATPWAWVNQGGSSSVQAQGSLLISPALEFAGENQRAVLQAISGTFKVRAKMGGYLFDADYSTSSLFVANNASGKIMSVGRHYNGGPKFAVAKYTDPTTYVGGTPSYFVDRSVAFGSLNQWHYFEIEYDGTNLFFRTSATGHDGTFETLFTESTATFLGTPDRIGLGGGTFHATLRPTIAIDWFRRVA